MWVRYSEVMNSAPTTITAISAPNVPVRMSRSVPPVGRDSRTAGAMSPAPVTVIRPPDRVNDPDPSSGYPAKVGDPAPSCSPLHPPPVVRSPGAGGP